MLLGSTGRLNFPGFPNCPILGCVDMETKVNFIVYFSLVNWITVIVITQHVIAIQ